MCGESTRAAIRDEMRNPQISIPKETPEVYLDKFTRMGGIVEEFMDAKSRTRPGPSARSWPRRVWSPPSARSSQ